MIMTVERFTNDGDSTLSLVFVDGKFLCFGLEDEPREEKIPGETRIPAGRYRITARKIGRMNKKYAQRFKGIHFGMLWIRDVPKFEHVLIHCGNTETDTAGCLLVGRCADAGRGKQRILFSSEAYIELYQEVINEALNKKLFIDFFDRDRKK